MQWMCYICADNDDDDDDVVVYIHAHSVSYQIKSSGLSCYQVMT